MAEEKKRTGPLERGAGHVHGPGCAHEHGRGGEHEHSEKLQKITVTLEEDQIRELRSLAEEYKDKLGQRWTISAMVRVAVGDFLTKMGRFS